MHFKLLSRGWKILNFTSSYSMLIFLFFRFWVTTLRLKNKKFHFELLTRWVHFHFRVKNVKLMYEKNNYYKMTCTALFYYVFLYLACFVVGTYVIFICVCWILMAYTNSTTNIFIHKITEENYVAVSRRGNDQMQVYI